MTITVPTALIRQIDHLAKADYATRSDVIRTALTEYLRKPQNLQKLAAGITGKDVVLQNFLDEYKRTHPE